MQKILCTLYADLISECQKPLNKVFLICFSEVSLENPSKDRQRFVDAVVLKGLLIGQTGFRTSNMLLRRFIESVFEHRTMLNFAKLK